METLELFFNLFTAQTKNQGISVANPPLKVKYHYSPIELKEWYKNQGRDVFILQIAFVKSYNDDGEFEIMRFEVFNGGLITTFRDKEYRIVFSLPNSFLLVNGFGVPVHEFCVTEQD